MYRITKTIIGRSGKISEVELRWVDNDYDGGTFKRGRRSKIKQASWKNFVDIVATGLVAGIKLNTIDKAFKFTNDNFSWEDIRSEDIYGNVLREGNPVIVYADSSNTIVSVPGKGFVNNYDDADTLFLENKANIPSMDMSHYLSRKEIVHKLYSDRYKEFNESNLGAAFNEELYKTGKNDMYSCLSANDLSETASIVRVDKVFEAVEFRITDKHKTRLIDLTNCKLYTARIDLSGSHNIQIKVGDIRNKFNLNVSAYTGKIDLQFCGSFIGSNDTYSGANLEIRSSKLDELKISSENFGYSVDAKNTDIMSMNELDKAYKFNFVDGQLPCDLKVNYFESNLGYNNGRFYLSGASGLNSLDINGFKEFSVFRCNELSELNIKANRVESLYLNSCKNIDRLAIDAVKVEAGKFSIQQCEVIKSFKVNLEMFNPDLYNKSKRSVIFTGLTYFTGDITVNGETDEQSIKALIGSNNYEINKINQLGIYSLAYQKSDLGHSGIVMYGLNIDRVRKLIVNGTEGKELDSIRNGVIDVPSDVSIIDIVNDDVKGLKSIGIHSIRLNNYCRIEKLEGLTIENSEYVSKIDRFAFVNNKDIKEFVCGDKLYAIGGFAFAGCNNLENLVLNESLREIRIGSLANCKKIGISGSYDRENLKISPLFRFRARDMHTAKVKGLRDIMKDYEDDISNEFKKSFRFTCIALVYVITEMGAGSTFSSDIFDILGKAETEIVSLYILIRTEVACYKYLKAEAKRIGEDVVLDRCLKAMEFIWRHYDSYASDRNSAASTLYSFKTINMDKVRAIKSLDTMLNI